jgi:hypothetical protein
MPLFLSFSWKQVSDSLEFREDEMEKAARDLRSTQAELRVLEDTISSGSLGGLHTVDEILADPKIPEGVPPVSVSTRLVRVVWPHQGTDVELTGSFNDWKEKVSVEHEITACDRTGLWKERVRAKYIFNDPLVTQRV